ncbi:MAG: BatA domain-containing protein [Flavobacteriales bacterium]|jgi:hypothetical protein|nr:BatA domain-containing protein [Flavobacteriales bacterium]
MSFLNPVILFFLFTILLVILIHILNLKRYKKHYFSNFKLLEELTKEQNRKVKYKNLFLILLRSMIVSALVLAFAQFFVGNKNQKKANSLAIFIDNSMSNTRKLGTPTILDLSKKYATELIESSQANQFLVLTNDFFRGKHLKKIGRKEALEKISNIQPSHFRQNIDFIYEQVSQNVAEETETYFLGDFQENQYKNLHKIQRNDSNQVYLIPFSTEQTGNISIEKVALKNPILISGEPIELVVTLKNHSAEAQSKLKLKVLSHKKQLAIAQTDLMGASEQDVLVKFSLPNRHDGKLEIKIQDPFYTSDNQFFLTIPINNKPKVVLISNEDISFLTKLFQKANYEVIVQKPKNLNLAALEQVDLWVLNKLGSAHTAILQKAKKQLESGANVWFIPSDSREQSNDVLRLMGSDFRLKQQDENPMKITQVVTNNPLFKGVFNESNIDISAGSLQSEKHWELSETFESKELLQLANGQAFLSYQNTKKGLLFLQSSSFEHTNFEKHTLFVPISLNMGLIKANPTASHLVIGKSDRIELHEEEKEETLRILYRGNKMSPKLMKIQGKQIVVLSDLFNKQGFVDILRGEEIVQSIGLNNDNQESEMSFLSVNKLAEITESSHWIHLLDNHSEQWNAFLNNHKKNQSSSYFFLMLALVFYVIEMIYLAFQNKRK